MTTDLGRANDDRDGDDRAALARAGDDLDGHTLEELGDYLDRGRLPLDPSIENSPECRRALVALESLRRASRSMIETEMSREPRLDESWVGSILAQVSLEARHGRSIPLTSPDETTTFDITEGTVRGLIRAAGDTVGGLLVGRTELVGDVTVPGEQIVVRLDVSVFWGERIPEVVAHLREAVYSELLRHTELAITSIDVVVHDVHFARPVPVADPREVTP